jgi:hypothetical protein
MFTPSCFIVLRLVMKVYDIDYTGTQEYIIIIIIIIIINDM